MALFYSKGTISYMSEITTGTSQSGREWARMNIMIDIPGYQGSITKLSFQVGTDRIDDVTAFKIGDRVEIGWSIYAREWNGRWFNNVDLVNIKSQDQQIAHGPVRSEAPAPAPAPAAQAMQYTQEQLDPAAHDDLPW